LGATRVERGARLDNLVQIGHGARVGARSLLAAFAGLAGRARLGSDSMVGARASLKEGVDIGPRAQIAAHAGVTKSAGEDTKLAGFPARSHSSWLREIAFMRRLSASDKEVER
jgi:UDP-3-O-[3-hydroxymyristoyl] glucosamine N-acyltransferase